MVFFLSFSKVFREKFPSTKVGNGSVESLRDFLACRRRALRIAGRKALRRRQEVTSNNKLSSGCFKKSLLVLVSIKLCDKVRLTL